MLVSCRESLLLLVMKSYHQLGSLTTWIHHLGSNCVFTLPLILIALSSYFYFHYRPMRLRRYYVINLQTLWCRELRISLSWGGNLLRWVTEQYVLCMCHMRVQYMSGMCPVCVQCMSNRCCVCPVYVKYVTFMRPVYVKYVATLGWSRVTCVKYLLINHPRE